MMEQILSDPAAALAAAEARAQRLVITTQQDYEAALTFSAECKLAARRLEERRLAEGRPLRAALADIDRLLGPPRDAFRALAARVEQAAAAYLTAARQAAEQAQLAAAQRAEQERQRLLAAAAQAQQQAGRAEANGDPHAARVAREQAEQAQLAAAAVPTPIVAPPSATVATGTATVTVRQDRTWLLPGWDGRTPLPLTDERFRSLIGPLEALPSGVQFLLRAGVLASAQLNALWRAGVPFPAPFETVTKARSIVRPRPAARATDASAEEA